MTPTEIRTLNQIREAVAKEGPKAVLAFTPGMCGCMGAQPGETRCPCAITSWAQETVLTELLGSPVTE